MQELVIFLVNSLTDGKADFTVKVEGDASRGDITIIIDKADIGKIIGKQGRIAKAIRTIVKAASVKENKKYTVEIVEKEGAVEA